MAKYIAKPDMWFKAGTEAKLIDDYRPALSSGLFEGVRVCENPASEGTWHVVGEEYEDEEVCLFDEFEVINNAPESPKS